MNTINTRREFLADVGRGMIVASIGGAIASELGLAPAFALDAPDASKALDFGELEPLVALMQETPVNRLLPTLTGKLKSGADLRKLVAAAALANARTFGGEDYVGFHTLMAMTPAYHMARELPEKLQPLPVFKVLYRNTNRIQEHGGRKDEVLHPVEPGKLPEGLPPAEALRAAVHRKDVKAAEETLAALAQVSAEDAFNYLLHTVQETTEVHRVVLPYRQNTVHVHYRNAASVQALRATQAARTYPRHTRSRRRLGRKTQPDLFHVDRCAGRGGRRRRTGGRLRAGFDW